ncbi:MAG: hypothetical protein P4L41_18895 [Flavipsychrobacter sp.]|nr:hypothetical protein [Flavipsychrobacter sp.]
MMNIKTTLLSVLLLMISFSALCQDKIYKRDGTVLNVVVKEVSEKNIKYKKFDNQTGPDYAIAKDDIERITYQNGSEDTFDGGDMPRRPSLRDVREEMLRKRQERKVARPKTYMEPNILAIAPLQLSDNGIGFGISYERSLDKGGIISFYVPAYLTWSVNSNGNYYNGNGTQTGNGVVYDPMFYIAPGIKIYPTGSQGKVKYSVGPNLVFANGSQTNFDNYYYPTQTRENRFMMGVMVVNALNINPTPKVYLGLELGLGGTYINKTGGVLDGANTLVEFSFRIGYRFK